MTGTTLSKIKIKRSTSAEAPGGLEFGELAYSTAESASGGTQTNMGDRLFFKYDAAGAAKVIGGKYFTDMLDHVHGTLTADSAIVTDVDSKIDSLKSGDLVITGSTNTIKNMASDSDIHIDTTGTGKVNINNWKLPNSKGTGTDGWVLTIDETTGLADWAAPSTTLNILLDGGDDVAIDLLSEDFTIEGDNTTGVDTEGVAVDNKVIIKMKTATSSQLGVAKFDTTGFVVSTTAGATLGNVTLKSDVAQSFGDATTGTATPAANKIKIVGDPTSGVLTTASSDQVKIEVGKATTSQLGVAKFNADYWDLTDNDGNIKIDAATTTDLGLAKFKDDYFTVVSGLVTPKDATLVGNVGTKGIASFKSDNFSVTGGEVTTKSFTIGSTSLNNGGTETVFEGLTDVTIGDLNFASDEISSTGDINLIPVGDLWINNAYTLPTSSNTTGYVLTINGSSASWQAAATSLKYKDNVGTLTTLDLLNGNFEIVGDGTVIKTLASAGTGANDKKITISVEKASTTALGVASFSSDNFAVSVGGEVTIKDGGVANAELVNSKVTIGTTDISLGSSSTVLDGLTDVTIGDVQIKSLNTGNWTNEYVINAKTGDLNLGATGGFVNINGYFTLPNSMGSATTAQTLANTLDGGQALVSDGSGGSDWQDIPYILQVNDGTTDVVIELLQDTLYITGDGDQGVSVTATGTTFDVSVANATDTTVGVARFKSGDFIVGATNAGEVELDDTVVQSVVSDSGTVTPTSNSIDIKGYTGANANNNAVTTSGSGAVLTITARLASDEVTGVASFNATNFTVDANGAVTSDEFTIGSTNLNLGGSTTVLAGLTDVTIGNIQIHDTNKIEYTTSDNEIHTGDIVLKPYTDTAYFTTNSLPVVPGVVDVSSSRITNVASPVDGTDAVNKAYTDSLVSGLDIKNSVRAATNAALTATYANGPGTLTNSGTQVALSGGLIDGVTLALGDRVLVKNQGITVDGAGAKTAGANSVQNGIYTVTTLGSGSVNWVLTRADDANNTPEGEVTGGMFTFVEEGNTWADSGFILVAADGAVTLGTTYLTFTQFSAAGQTMAGLGLSKVGDTLNVEVNDTTGGIEITADKIQLKSAVGGDGLTYTDGVLAVGGTLNRISVGVDAIDIDANYIGQNTITTLGTITDGTWQGDTVMETYGGTGQDSYAKGDILYASAPNVLSKLVKPAAGWKFLRFNDTSEIPEWSDIDGGTY